MICRFFVFFGFFLSSDLVVLNIMRGKYECWNCEV